MKTKILSFTAQFFGNLTNDIERGTRDMQIVAVSHSVRPISGAFGQEYTAIIVVKVSDKKKVICFVGRYSPSG